MSNLFTVRDRKIANVRVSKLYALYKIANRRHSVEFTADLLLSRVKKLNKNDIDNIASKRSMDVENVLEKISDLKRKLSEKIIEMDYIYSDKNPVKNASDEAQEAHWAWFTNEKERTNNPEKDLYFKNIIKEHDIEQDKILHECVEAVSNLSDFIDTTPKKEFIPSHTKYDVWDPHK